MLNRTSQNGSRCPLFHARPFLKISWKYVPACSRNGANSQLDTQTNGDENIPDRKVHGANIGPTWALSAPGEPHVGHMNLAIWDDLCRS